MPCRPVSWSDSPWKGLPCSQARAALFTSCGRSTRGLGRGTAEPGRPRGHLPDWESDPSAADGRRDTVRVSVSVFTDTRRTRTFLLSVFSASAHLPSIEREDTSWSRRCKSPPRRSGPEELDVEPPANCVNLGGLSSSSAGARGQSFPRGFQGPFLEPESHAASVPWAPPSVEGFCGERSWGGVCLIAKATHSRILCCFLSWGLLSSGSSYFLKK